MKVECSVEKFGRDVNVTCGRCGRVTTSAVGADADKSVRRCLALLREDCPQEERNYYVTDDGAHETGGYENLVSSGKAPRGREVELLVKDKPLRPPGRRA